MCVEYSSQCLMLVNFAATFFKSSTASNNKTLPAGENATNC